MGMGTSNTLDRVMARFGLIDGVETRFEPMYDISFGGILLALPALLSTGLLLNIDNFFAYQKVIIE